MQYSPTAAATNQRLEMALRVLVPITRHIGPDQQDIEDLLKIAGPIPPDMQLDEFACHIIQNLTFQNAN